MTVVRYGDFGRPLLLFPTAGGDHLDNERFKLIEMLRPFIESRRLKVYGCGSINKDGWINPDAAPWHKSWLQARFDAYLSQELLPAIQNDCGGFRPFIAAGASLGAYNAVTAACKHPEWFDLAIGLSGTYDFDRWMGGHRDAEYYYNQPMYFLGKLEGAHAEALKKVHFVVATGSGRYEAPEESRRIGALLESKGAKVNLEIWDTNWHHDWPTWRAMLPLFLGKLLA
jgi:esterase/lipase superfamily enzyme